MAPLTPHWAQPSHPDALEVVVNEAAFTSKSLSKATVPPFGLFAKMSFPPCTLAEEPTYATVQIGRNKHLNLNSDLLYINHSCEPSLIFDTANLNILAGPKGLKPGDELTFFYPSTEWDMAQPFDCFCGKPTCRGRISGAKGMAREQLEGVWLNGHIRELLEERQQERNAKVTGKALPGNGKAPASQQQQSPAETLQTSPKTNDPTAQALEDALRHAEKVVEAARAALLSYATASAHYNNGPNGNGHTNGNGYANGGAPAAAFDAAHGAVVSGATRRGPTSRELSGEMGGDTTTAAAPAPLCT